MFWTSIYSFVISFVEIEYVLKTRCFVWDIRRCFGTGFTDEKTRIFGRARGTCRRHPGCNRKRKVGRLVGSRSAGNGLCFRRSGPRSGAAEFARGCLRFKSAFLFSGSAQAQQSQGRGLRTTHTPLREILLSAIA